MSNYHPEEWCAQKNWTEPRQLENGIWVAFPPGGVIETPLPNQFWLEPQHKLSLLQKIAEGLILVFSAIFVAIVALAIAPCFLFDFMKRRKKKSKI